jgi:hypothetical protein
MFADKDNPVGQPGCRSESDGSNTIATRTYNGFPLSRLAISYAATSVDLAYVVASFQKLYSIFVGSVVQMDESSWSNDEHRGETSQYIIWRYAKKINW